MSVSPRRSSCSGQRPPVPLAADRRRSSQASARAFSSKAPPGSARASSCAAFCATGAFWMAAWMKAPPLSRRTVSSVGRSAKVRPSWSARSPSKQGRLARILWCSSKSMCSVPRPGACPRRWWPRLTTPSHGPAAGRWLSASLTLRSTLGGICCTRDVSVAGRDWAHRGGCQNGGTSWIGSSPSTMFTHLTRERTVWCSAPTGSSRPSWTQSCATWPCPATSRLMTRCRPTRSTRRSAA
mmetsp:Transcript_2461/g.7566  ORF Transcript_2461/g.7566 Transcript_2461/m.7566 type:complete len:239 (+) Transcript_2461:460-1176(+)